MKIRLSKEFGILGIVVLISSLGTVGLSSVQYAWADPGPTCLLPSAFTTLDSFITWTCWGDAAFTPHTSGVTVVYRSLDETATPDTTVTFSAGASCTPITVGGGGGADGLTDAFLLDNADIAGTQANLWTIPHPTVGPSFPPGPIAGSQDSITFNFPSAPGPVITSITADGTAPPPSLAGSSAWVQIGTGGATPSLSLGSWVIGTCVIDGSTGVTGGDIDSFIVQKPVAGEVLPIDATALLIAGATQNGILILSSLAIIAGVSFALLRFQVYTKSK
jgi:hypothetical protein